VPEGLDFEKPLLELTQRIEALRQSTRATDEAEAAKLEERLARLQKKVFGRLSAWERVLLARHPRRPYTLDLIRLMVEDFVELHGDRLYGDDHAIVAGLGHLGAQRVVVIGHQKGRDTEERLYRNFGQTHPEGYRKALRLMQLAERFRRPVLTLVDTPGAYPGVGAEERGQAEAIARNLREMAGLRTPIIAVITGEGGSGGALALAVADRVLMLEHAIYSVISPEGCAAILWEDARRAREAAEVLRVTAPDLLKLGVVDGVVAEPPGGAHRHWAATAHEIKGAVTAALAELGRVALDDLVQQRYAKFRRMGIFEETL
jgi:acetyl-CoA carboxylase carboxyl transferase subunit alpha